MKPGPKLHSTFVNSSIKQIILRLITRYACMLLGLLAFPQLIASAPSPKVFVCPPCGCASDGRTFDKPGKCPDCGMTLIEKGSDPRPSVAILLFNGAEIIDFAGPWEVFGESGFNVFTVAEKRVPITAVFGQKIVPDYTFADSPHADVLVVPGGGVSQAVDNSRLIKWVQANAQSSQHVMSVCTGAFILAKAGLLDGLSATTIKGSIDELARFSPKTTVVYDKRYVDNGKIITTGGLSAGIDGAFHVVEKLKGKTEAEQTAQHMEYRWEH